ncbi:lactonase family protein [Pirellulaceae bacterium SH467]
MKITSRTGASGFGRLLALSFLAWAFAICPCSAQPFFLGGYGDGIYSSYLHQDGSMDVPKLLAKQNNASFFCLHPRLPILYAVTETMRDDPNHPAAVVAYRFDANAMHQKQDASLKEVNRQRIDGDIPCHVTTDSQGRYLVIANYTNGSVVVYPIQADGSIGNESCNVVHTVVEGKKRSNGHCSAFSPNDRFVLVCDLGLDRVFVYEMDYETGKLKPGAFPFLELPAGAGPRHLSFHPDGKRVFIINETNLTMTSADWDAATGRLAVIHHEPTVPEGVDRKGFSTAEVLVHPSGRYVYGSNRGHDTIAVMELDRDSGRLERTATVPTLGKTPRNFRFDPTGKWLLAENQTSNTIYTFAVDPASGQLTPTQKKVDVKAPACIRFVPEFVSK